MATIEEILQRKFPGMTWTMGGQDTYSTLVWADTNPIPKPSLVAIRAFREEVNALLREEERARKRETAMLQEPGSLFLILESTVDALDEIRRKARPALFDEQVDWTALRDLRQRLKAIKQAL